MRNVLRKQVKSRQVSIQTSCFAPLDRNHTHALCAPDKSTDEGHTSELKFQCYEEGHTGYASCEGIVEALPCS